MDRQKLTEWLDHSTSASNQYTHRLLKENLEYRETILSELKQEVQKAHEDTKRHLRQLAGFSLDPLDTPTIDVISKGISENIVRDPTEGYPEKLELKTLKGFFGEIFAGIIAENFSHFDIAHWKVPAYPFRFHNSAYDQLERWRQTETNPRTTPGRTGDDMVAFYQDSRGKITHSLVCEAKCSNGHKKSLINKAHNQANSKEPRPVEILRLIDILRDYDDPDSQNWRKSLQILYSRNIQSDYERCDLVSYICGATPKKSQTWMQKDTPHPNYTVGRRLESVEIHLQGVDTLVMQLYGVEAHSEIDDLISEEDDDTE